MKLKFKNQAYQTHAVDSVVDLFKGQEKKHSTFSVTHDTQITLMQNEYGIGNALTLNTETLLKNMQDIQRKNHLPLTSDLGEKNFSVEMETGTGKTYVYIKTIFELNKQYGFTKFIIVVPSVAIREGVYKSLQITNEHFSLNYDNVPYRYFIYNSSKLSDVRQFATSSDIEIMVINIDAFKKSENIINQEHDKLGGESAMRYIKDTNPVVIIDEPQSVDNTSKSKEAISSLNPLAVFRYSATHKDKINLLYRLTPVDAYQMGLVKQISVSSNTVANDFNKPYIKLLSVNNDNGFSAKVEIDKVSKAGKVERKTITVKASSDLFVLSGDRFLYDGYIIDGIDCTPDYECIEFTNGERLKLGQAMGNIDENILKKAQIKRTIETHLEKELRYTEKGIKVLSLFFIDEVKKYRDYDTESTKGIYAKMFEESYDELINLPKFADLKERFTYGIDKIHDGYFSADKKGIYKNTKGDTLDDYNTYNTIMKDKEWLLSFDCPLRFIWSHSALKEGWDNPNVFQVCTLIEQKSNFTCRQKIGRGLRLCVDQDGNRIEDKNINVLHVMANESFAEFADTLQKEIEQETGLKFGVLDIGLFSGMTYQEEIVEQKKITKGEVQILVEYMSDMGYLTDDGKPSELVKKEIENNNIVLPAELEVVKQAIVEVIAEDKTITEDVLIEVSYTETKVVEKEVSYDDATMLIKHFEDKGYVGKNGKMKDTLKNDLMNGTLDLPKKFESAREKFEKLISKADNKPPIRDASRDVVVKLNKQVLLSPEFLALWDKIKHKTMYKVSVDDEILKQHCVKALKEIPDIPKARILTNTADINVQKSGITHTERGIKTTDIDSQGNRLPDFLREVDEECFLTWKIYLDILLESGKMQDLLNNPQTFTEIFIDVVKNVQHSLEIDGISYVKLEEQEYYMQEIFDSEELIANLDKNAVKVENSAYDYVIYDSSTVEKPFAIALDNDPEVKLFFKIPDKFKIDTPIGTYNPDWAVFIEKNGDEKLYFILETKGSTNLFDLRSKEKQKIQCGERHFKALDNDAQLKVAKNWAEFKVNN